MKKIISGICIIIFVFVSVFSSSFVSYTPDISEYITKSNETIRGLWIASVYNIDFPSAPDLTCDTLKSEIESVIAKAASLGINTIFFQVHPSADALYKSDLFPVSDYLSSDGVLCFDVLEYFIKSCHESGLSLHAWFNPLRVTASSYSSRKKAFECISSSYSALSDNEFIVFHSDGRLYYDAGFPQVRELIAKGVYEIVCNYDVDGVIFDDYFYPDSDFDDSLSYTMYGNDSDIGDWRRNNINDMIEECYDEIKKVREDCMFGVSPCGIWQNNDGVNGGTDTRGLEGYSELYCDAPAWAKGGYVDYISPQIYWEFSDEVAPFGEICHWWDEILTEYDCKLIPSLGCYKYNGIWENPEGEITEQIEFAEKMKRYGGIIYYGYTAISANSLGVADEIYNMNNTAIH